MEKCKPSIQCLFTAIEKGYLPHVQKIWRDLDDSNPTDNIVLNGVKLGWRAVHFAAKQGHVATVEMLYFSGAVIDAYTRNNENPLLLALQSHMRDTVRKLINLGAKMDNYTESLVYHYINRGKLPPDTLNRSNNPNFQMNKSNETNQSYYSVSQFTNDRQCSFIDDVFINQALINQLQHQSTAYDLELTRRKRELTKRLTVMNSFEKSGNLLLQLIQRSARVDIPIDSRLSSISEILDLLPDIDLTVSSTGMSKLMIIGSTGVPYLRLIEVCLCESHCPIELSTKFSELAIRLVLCGANKSPDANGMSTIDDVSQASNTPSIHIMSYVSKLLKKLILKSNAQYRSGILSHISRIISASNMAIHELNESDCSMWCTDISTFSSIILSNLIRLGEVLDQPINVSKFTKFVGLVANFFIHISQNNPERLSMRFSDLADILVGWAVDLSSISKGINLESIYDELKAGLAYWFLIPSDETNGLCVNENFREMMIHLLEDCEHSLNIVVNEYHNVGMKRSLSNGCKNPFDSNIHFMSVSFFLKILSSIIKGFCCHFSTYADFAFDNLLMLPDGLNQWIRRIIYIIKSSSSCYRSMLQRQNISWHSKISIVCIQASLLDSIEISALEIISNLISFSDCNSENLQIVEKYVISRISDENDRPFSNTSLSAILELIKKIFEFRCSTLDNGLLNPNILYAYFGPHTKLHLYKACVLTNKNGQSPFEHILSMFCLWGRIKSLQYSILKMVLADFKLALSSIHSQITGCENLGLFSIFVLLDMWKMLTTELKNEVRNCLVDVRYYFLEWLCVPHRLRISILSLITIVFSEKPDLLNLQVLCQNFVTGNPSYMECKCYLSLVENALIRGHIDPNEELIIFFELIRLGEYILGNKFSQGNSTSNTFSKCVNILMKFAFESTIFKSHKQVLTKLFYLSKLALSYPCLQIQQSGNDLLLLLRISITSKLLFPADNFFSELYWFKSHRLDNSPTSLLIPDLNTMELNGGSPLVSVSAFPSLPAVAGVLGIITRGSPYNLAHESSRLKILRQPNDWIRRLACLISPIPADYKCQLKLLQSTSFISPILWYAAWAVVDYKLKVAPWANPLKTFLSLEGTLHAFLQPLNSIDKSANASQMSTFHLASSESHVRQTASRQLKQSGLLLRFLDYLERIVVNATHGFAFALPRPMISACNFFVANENTCTQWFNRICNLIIRLNSNLPLTFSGSCTPHDGASCSIVYHAYSLLQNVNQYINSENSKDWDTHFKQFGGSIDMFINLSKALHDLGAWEDLKALDEWTNTLPHPYNKQLAWLNGVAVLTQGQWDNALCCFNDYLENVFKSTSPTLSKEVVDLDGGYYHIQSVVYVADMLLQIHMSEGNYAAASSLHKRVFAFVNDFYPENTSNLSTSSFALKCKRLECINKLSGWTPNKNVNSSLSWLSTSCHQHLNTLLMKSVNVTNDSDLSNNLNEIISVVRRTSSALNVLPSLNPMLKITPRFGQVQDDNLCEHVVRADLLMNHNFAQFSKTLNPVGYSSLAHLISPQSTIHIGAEMFACQQACAFENPELAKRLLSRLVTCLSPLDNDSPTQSKSIDMNMDLHEIVSFVRSNKIMKLNSLHTLCIYDSLSRIAWLSKDTALDNKLFSFSMLTQGLKMTLLDEKQVDANDQIDHCKLMVDSALRLFDWLISFSDISSDQTWAEKIYLEARNCTLSNDCKPNSAYSIACDLDLFTQLADEPWVYGLPILTAQISNASRKPKYCPALWTNRLLMMATHISPTGLSPNAWLKMANWCYSRGHAETTEIQNAALKYIENLDTDNVDQTTVTILSKLLKPHESDLAISILNYNKSKDEQLDSSVDNTSNVNALIAALVTFGCPTIPSRFNHNHKIYDQVNTYLNFSAKCLDDHLESQTFQDLFLHLVKVLPGRMPEKFDSDLQKLLHKFSCSIHESIYTLHTSAAQAYATFLTIADQPSLDENNLFTKLDTTSATLKFLDLLCMPSCKLRKLISGFLDHASPVVPVDHKTNDAPSVSKNPTNNAKMDSFGYLERIKSGPTLGGPMVWEACLPQLLVRLTMPDPIIRDCLVVLLGRLIMRTNGDNLDSQWSCSPSIRLSLRLVFPAVIAASRFTDSKLGNEFMGGQAGELLSVLQTKTSPQKCTDSCSFNEIIMALQKAGLGTLVNQVEMFTFELQRITLLWEELWIGCLIQHVDDLTKKISSLEHEIKRMKSISINSNVQSLKSNDEKENLIISSTDQELHGHKEALIGSDLLHNLIHVKHASILQPTLDLLSQLCALTLDVKPETPHEEWFQRTFGLMIHNLRESLLYPLEVHDIKQPLVLITRLIHQLQTVHQPNQFISITKMNKVDFMEDVKTSNVCYLSLHQLSPKLSNMRFTNSNHNGESSHHRSISICGIPMPGHRGIRASSLANRIAVLPTKTRPKRLLLRAANGRVYPYLLKGLEDLRLDDRIMQLFDLTNLALAQNSLLSSSQMHARTYSVTPLGPRSGLLQMVQGAVPLFSLYNRWQIRSNNSAVHSKKAVIRPGELFHSRLKEMLLASGQPYQPNVRSSWSLNILKQVFTSLEKETPADLLSRELWAFNSSCASWWKVSQTFAKSSGLMSILGYLVGLGDRHLDNLLVDLATGHMIHIDYNVCFNKGRYLRVAERVPFRLTRILRHALGPVAQDHRQAVRGTFRISAEMGLNIARTITDPFLIQLKAFILDPLVDWQHRKLHSTVADFTHLSTFYGGGNVNSGQNRTASIYRRLRRIDAEIHMHVGMLTVKLAELDGGPSGLLALYQALDSITCSLPIWLEWSNSRKQACLLHDRYTQLNTASSIALDQCQKRCDELANANSTVVSLHQQLVSNIDLWNDEVMLHLHSFADLPLSTLSNLSLSCQSEHSNLSVIWSKYYQVAKIYLASTDYKQRIDRTIKCWTQLYANLRACLDKSSSVHIDMFINRLTVDDQLQSDCIDALLPTKLTNSIDKYESLLQQVHDRQTEAPNSSCTLDSSQTVLHEVENLILFVKDQGLYGISAYCWTLLNVLLDMAKTCLALESNPKDWQCPNSKPLFVFDHLLKINTHAECLANFATVLQNPSSETYRFTAGYEADGCREIGFLNLIVEATSCMTQLYTNLIKLLIPEAIEALACVDPIFVEQFTAFVVSTMAKSDASNLRQLVNDFLMKHIVITNEHETRLHQVLLGVHLVLVNATDQMEELAFKLKNNGITAPAWYYVDIVSQVVSVLLSKCSNWQVGATSLWCSESDSYFTGSHVDDDNVCSWSDEIYASGLTAFISILEDGIVHWSSIKRACSSDDDADLTLNLFDNAINVFMGRLTSRISLASLVALGSCRLFCGLIEDMGLSIRRIVFETELNVKAIGSAVPVSLLATKLIESANIQNSMTNSMNCHLRTPASNLSQRLMSCSLQTANAVLKATEIESIERHLTHLRLSLSVYMWMHNVTYCDSQVLTVPCTDLVDTLQQLKQALDSHGDELKPIGDVSLSLWTLENIRTGALRNFPAYSVCLNLANDLKQAILDKNTISSSLSQLDSIVLAVQDIYHIDIPVSDWNSKELCDKLTVLDQLKADVSKATNLTAVLSQRLKGKRQDFCDKHVNPEAVSDLSPSTDHSAQPKLSKRHRRAHAHSRNVTLLPVVQNSTNVSDSNLHSHSPVMTSLRVVVEKFQTDWLAPIHQLVKPLGRYELLRDNLIQELVQFPIASVPNQRFVWCVWLNQYQKWTDLARNVLKKLSKLLNYASVTSKNAILDDSDGLMRSDELEDEVQLASAVYDDLLRIKWQLRHCLVSPMFEAIDASIKSESQFAKLLHTLTTSVRSALVDNIETEFVQFDKNEEFKLPESQQQPLSDLLNPHAVNAWQRVFDRLHGFHSVLKGDHLETSSEPLSVASQVDKCIGEATDIDNLALMYEGWIAWV